VRRQLIASHWQASVPPPGSTLRRVPKESLRRRLLGPLAVTVHRGALWLAALLPRRSATRTEGPVRILLAHAWGMGGTIRTTLTIAAYLSERH
jgi:hypothetical protein